jgi:UDP-glucose 4-epimerase
MSFTDSNVLVTGGAGFIGANLAKILFEKRAKITIFDDFSSGSMLNLKEIKNYVTIVRGDVRDFESVKKVVANQDFVFHMAANASVPNSIENPSYDFKVNALGTLNVLKALLDLDSDALLVFASSAGVYGEQSSTPISEKSSLKPLSPYGASKLTGEILCQTFSNVYGLRTLRLRYFNVYGPLQRKYVMFDLVNRLRKRQDILEVLGTGNQIRDFIYISDAIDAALLLAKTPSAFGEVFNIGTGTGITIRELVNLILSVLGLECKTKVLYTNKSWEGDVQKFIAGVKKIKEYGFQHKVDLKTGLVHFIDWYDTSYLQEQRNI